MTEKCLQSDAKVTCFLHGTNNLAICFLIAEAKETLQTLNKRVFLCLQYYFLPLDATKPSARGL